MLYNPRKDAFSLDRLIAWLEQQPPDKTYVYMYCEECLLAQYAKHIGVTYDYERTFPDTWERAANIRQIPKTFGAALEAFRALQSGH